MKGWCSHSREPYCEADPASRTAKQTPRVVPSGAERGRAGPFDGWRDVAVHCGREKAAATNDLMRRRRNVWVGARMDARADAERAVGWGAVDADAVRVGRCLVYGVLIVVPASPPAVSPFASGAGGSRETMQALRALHGCAASIHRHQRSVHLSALPSVVRPAPYAILTCYPSGEGLLPFGLGRSALGNGYTGLDIRGANGRKW